MHKIIKIYRIKSMVARILIIFSDKTQVPLPKFFSSVKFNKIKKSSVNLFNIKKVGFNWWTYMIYLMRETLILKSLRPITHIAVQLSEKHLKTNKVRIPKIYI